jgi:Holliday junction DNA helicase RuvA
MIASLRGRLISKRPDHVVIECAGVGYHVNVPVGVLSNISDVGGEVFLHIYTHVREDALQLFGFKSEDEKRVFTALINVSGIGPKIAISILSTYTPAELQRALDNEDVAMLCRIPGLGKKTAQRLILELREKLPKSEDKSDALFDDTLSALLNLGYRRAEALEALERAYRAGHKTIETLIKDALRHLTRE